MKTLFLAALIAGIPALVFSCGTSKKKTGPQSGDAVIIDESDTVTLTGRVQIYGSEPHTFPGIVDAEGVEYAVYAPGKDGEIRDLQGYLIEFTVVFLKDNPVYESLFLKGGTVKPIEWKIIE
jgi:hypothetical protein